MNNNLNQNYQDLTNRMVLVEQKYADLTRTNTELKATSKQLRATNEQLQATNEALRATSEGWRATGRRYKQRLLEKEMEMEKEKRLRAPDAKLSDNSKRARLQRAEEEAGATEETWLVSGAW
jgi:hypothetical protein